MAREALALIEAGFQVDVICLRDRDDAKNDVVDGVNIYRLPVRRWRKGGFAGQLLEYVLFFILVALKLLQLYPQRKYQTVQAHNLPDFLVFSALLPKISGAKLILDIHDLMPEFFSATKGQRMDSFVARVVILQEKLACRFADHVITVTEIWRQRLISRGTPPEKVSVVMNVANQRIFHTNGDQPKQEKVNNGFRLIYHGTLKKHYGMEELIRGVAIASREMPDIHLTVQGVGEYHEEMQQLIGQLGVRDHVQLNAFNIPAAELPALIRQADVGVIPNHNDSFTGELLPTKLMEYIALDIPVLASKTKVISQYFDEEMVHFFNPEDPHSLAEGILFLYRNPERLRKIVAGAQEFKKMYSWQSQSRNYVKIIERLSHS